MNAPAVEIVIVNWNGRKETLECLAAVDAQRKDVADSVISVVDNGSTDGSPTAIAARYPGVRLFVLAENRGFTGGIAAALRASIARNIIFLNNDAIPEAGWLASLTRAIDEAPQDVISVGGKIVDLSGRMIDFIGGVMAFDGHALQNGFRFELGSRPEPKSGEELFFACGGNMISRRAALAELGGFDDDFFAYLEDVDFGWRSWLSGYRVTFEPAALVRHASSATSDRLGNFERGVLFERNALQTVIKNYEDDALREAAGAVFYSYLHRLHHYATSRNEKSTELRRAPFDGRGAAAPRGLFARVRRRLFGTQPLARIDDPLTTMQFRAMEWIVRNQEQLVAKRKAVQSHRKRSDAEIFNRFPLYFVPTYPGDDAMMSGPLFKLLRPHFRSVDARLGDIIRS